MQRDRQGKEWTFDKQNPIPSDSLVFLDSDHTYGEDLDLSEDAILRIIVTPSMTSTKLCQAMRRARKLKQSQQKIDLILPTELINTALDPNDLPASLVKHLRHNEALERQSDLLPAFKQQISALFVKRLLHKLLGDESYDFKRAKSLVMKEMPHKEYVEWASLVPGKSPQEQLNDHYSNLLNSHGDLLKESDRNTYLRDSSASPKQFCFFNAGQSTLFNYSSTN